MGEADETLTNRSLTKKKLATGSCDDCGGFLREKYKQHSSGTLSDGSARLYEVRTSPGHGRPNSAYSIRNIIKHKYKPLRSRSGCLSGCGSHIDDFLLGDGRGNMPRICLPPCEGPGPRTGEKKTLGFSSSSVDDDNDDDDYDDNYNVKKTDFANDDKECQYACSEVSPYSLGNQYPKAYPKVVQAFKPERKKYGDSKRRLTRMGKRLHCRKYESAKQTQTDWDWAESIQNEVEEREKREKEAAKSLETSQASAYDDLETPLISFGIGSEISDLTSSGRESADFPYLPSVGPPKILQYKRESVSKDSFECESEDFSGESFSDICKSYGIFSGDCEFCRKVIKPVPTLEQQETLPSEELYCCEKYKEFLELVFRAKLKELEVEQEEESSRMDDEEQDESSIKKEFKRRKKMAKIREQITKESKKQEDYQAEPQKPLINASLEESLTQGSGSLRSIAGTIHSKWSKNKIKKSQLGYAATSSFTGHQGEKTSETSKPGDKLEASQVSKSEKKDSKTEKKGVKLEIEESKMKTSKSEISVKKENLYKKEVLSSVGRQLNTINYQLSSEWCMALGWTLLKPTEIIEELDGDYFEAEPGTSLSLYSSMKPKANETLEKYYDNGQKFLTVFPDGTGNIFYPSGNVAIMITSLDSKHFTYIVQENVDIHPQILAFFSPTGDGCCYYSTGIVRLLIDPFGGIELDPDGARKKKWSWNDLEPHVHAPPLQPICVGINRFIGLRMVSQRNIHLSFMSRKYCCRFNIGTNIKLVTPGTLFKGVDDDKLFLREKIAHMESLLNKVTTLLRFPKSSRVERILPPLHLTNKLQRVELLRRQRDPTKIKKPITVMLHAK